MSRFLQARSRRRAKANTDSVAGVSQEFLLGWGTEGTGDGQFDRPVDVAVDTNNNVYVGDFGNRLIQRFDADGNFLSSFSISGDRARPWKGVGAMR